MSGVADRVRDAIDIVQIIGEVVSLKKQANRYSGLCPFHQEKSPSFTVSADKQLFHCFGCKAGGNVFHFVQKYYHWDFPQALEELAKKAGIDLETRSEDRERDECFKIMEEAVSFFEETLHSKAGEPAREYLTKRRIPENLWKEFRLGAHNGIPTALTDHLEKKGYSLELASRLGLIGKTSSGGLMDRYRSRLIFPLADERGRIRGVGARGLGNEMPKYINSPNSPIFDKKRLLYGMNLAISSGSIQRQDYAVLVEGYLDVIALHEFGVKTAVGTMGTALTSEQLRIIKRWTNRVVSLFDADDAGLAATSKGLELYLAEGLEAKVAVMRDGKDPDAFLHDPRTDLDEKNRILRELFKESVPALDYLIEKRVLTEKDSIRRAKSVKALVDLIDRVPDPVERSVLKSDLGARFSISFETFKKEEAHMAQKPQKKPLVKKVESKISVVREVLKFLVLFGKARSFGLADLLPYLSFSPISPMSLEDEKWAKILGEIIRNGYDSTTLAQLGWLESLDSETQALVREWVLGPEKDGLNSGEMDWSAVSGQWKVLELKLKRSFYDRESRRLQEAIQESEEVKDASRTRELLMEKQALVEMMKDFSERIS